MRQGKRRQNETGSPATTARPSGQQGLTLVEIATVVAIISLLALFAAPEIANWGPKNRLKGAAEKVFVDMQRAKIHAIKNNVEVTFSFSPTAACPGGGYLFTDASGGNVTSVTFGIPGAEFKDVCLSASTFPDTATPPLEGFSPRGLTISNTGGDITLTSSRIAGIQHKIVLSVAGGINRE